MYRPTMSRTFSTNRGSLDNRKVLTRWGWRLKARQTRETVDWDTPIRFARSRVLQWVRSVGVLYSVVVTMRSTVRSLILRGAPGRGSSKRPSRRLSWKR